MRTATEKLNEAEAEIARLEHIVQIQQKQIERLLEARAAEKILREQAEAQLQKNRDAFARGGKTYFATHPIV